MSEAIQTTEEETINHIAAQALRHAADCIEDLVDAGEPMGSRQTFRRGFNAADSKLVDSALSGKAFEAASDKVGDVAGMAVEHDINGQDAATFYRNQADALEN